ASRVTLRSDMIPRISKNQCQTAPGGDSVGDKMPPSVGVRRVADCNRRRATASVCPSVSARRLPGDFAGVRADYNCRFTSRKMANDPSLPQPTPAAPTYEDALSELERL